METGSLIVQRLIPFLVVLLAGAQLFGCAALQRQECEAMDWRQSGITNARDGQTFDSSLGALASKCDAVQGKVDRSAYRQGYDAGLLDYCTAESGKRQAIEGRVYAGICTARPEVEFLSGYGAGLTTYCTPANAYRLGTEVKEYLGVCTRDRYPDFVDAYLDGLEVVRREIGSRGNSAGIQDQQLVGTVAAAGFAHIVDQAAFAEA